MMWKKLPQAERDAAYDNAAAVPGSAARIARWDLASRDVRAEQPAHLNIAYGPKERNKWDLFPSHSEAPCLVFIHGGYWLRNSREIFACMASGVRSHGWSAALPGYTLAPQASLREIAAEVRAALDWFCLHRRNYAICGPVIVSGWSAGGHLATLGLDHEGVTAGLAISGLYELGPLRDTAYNQILNLTDLEIETLSPMRGPITMKPLILAYGENELPALIANSRDFHVRRSRSRAPGRILALAGHDHFSLLEELRSTDGALTRAALDLAAGNWD